MKITLKDYIKANKKANREIELENGFGWYAQNKIFQNKRKYKRKNKHKKSLEI
jgi:hypothetical protein